MPTADNIIQLIDRLNHAAKTQAGRRPQGFSADLRAACFLLRRLVSLLVLEEAKLEHDLRRRHALEQEATTLWTSAHEARQ